MGNGKVTIEAKEDRGKAEIEAETSGEGKVAVNGKYLIEALKACGGIVSLQYVSATSPVLFSADSYQAILMPIMLNETKPQAKATSQAEGKAVTEAEKVAKEAEAKPKGKAKRKAGKAKTEEAEMVEEAEIEPTEAELAELEAEGDRELVEVA
jgi:hypothetical protein